MRGHYSLVACLLLALALTNTGAAPSSIQEEFLKQQGHFMRAGANGSNVSDDEKHQFYIDVDFVQNNFTTQVPVHLANVTIGIQKQNLWISLQDQSLSIVSTKCTTCQTQEKHKDTTIYPYGNGSVPCAGGVRSITYQNGDDPNNKGIFEANRSGIIVEDVFKFAYEGKTDNISKDLKETYICQMQDIQTEDGVGFRGPGDANGYLGLAPYVGNDTDMLNINFMQRLMHNQTINKNIFALFLDHYRAKSVQRGTHIKFGGYDNTTETIMEGSSLQFLKTISTSSWNLLIDSATVAHNKQIDFKGKTKILQLMPNIPYIYLPADDFASYQSAVQEIYPDADCSSEACLIEKPCRGVKHNDISFEIDLGGALSAEKPIIRLELTLEQMLLDGSEVTGGTSKQCYLPIFKNQQMSAEANQTWYVGSYLLRKYYMVFDATAETDKDGQQYLKIGFAMAHHAKNDDNGGNDKHPKVPDDEDSLFDKLLPVLYAVITVCIVIFICVIWFMCHRMKQRAKIAKMSRDELQNNAEKIMNKYTQRMDKKSEAARKKALKKWQKKNPGKKLEDCNVSQLNTSMFASSVDGSRLGNSIGPGINRDSDMFGDIYLNNSQDSLYK